MNDLKPADFDDVLKALECGDDRRARTLLYRIANFAELPETKLGKIALAFSKVGNREAAVQILRQAIVLGADPHEYRWYLVQAFLIASMLEAAEATVTTMLEDEPDHLGALLVRSVLRALAHDEEGATEDYGNALLVHQAAATTETTPPPALATPTPSAAASTPALAPAAPTASSKETKGKPMTWWHSGSAPAWTTEKDKDDALSITFRPSAWPAEIKSVKVKVVLVKTAEGSAPDNNHDDSNDDLDDDVMFPDVDY